MFQSKRICFYLVVILIVALSWCSPLRAESSSSKTLYQTLEWSSLMPKKDLQALLNPPNYITEVEDGSLADSISTQVQNSLLAANDDAYQRALNSTEVIAAMDGKAIRIPGFIVPLSFAQKQVVTQFFLVPYFGACLHFPPPPPNQMIYVEYPSGYHLESLYDPVWLSGHLKVALTEHEMATAAYTMSVNEIELYTQ